jgi:hypothetical protein
MTIITVENLVRFWRPERCWGHTTALAPFLAIHAAFREKRAQGRNASPGQWKHDRWEWSDRAAVAECLPAVWRMTGSFQARRAVTVPRRALERCVMQVVPFLAGRLNRRHIMSLSDLSGKDQHSYNEAVRAIHDAVARISRLRDTKVTEPVLGSKVLHHYFPSVVPIFDKALIRNRALQAGAFRRFDEGSNDEGWIVFEDGAPGGPSMEDYHRYFAFVAEEIGNTKPRVLEQVRMRFARGFHRLAPAADLESRRSLLWRLDAKIAEYCLLGQAAHEGR